MISFRRSSCACVSSVCERSDARAKNPSIRGRRAGLLRIAIMSSPKAVGTDDCGQRTPLTDACKLLRRFKVGCRRKIRSVAAARLGLASSRRTRSDALARARCCRNASNTRNLPAPKPREARSAGRIGNRRVEFLAVLGDLRRLVQPVDDPAGVYPVASRLDEIVSEPFSGEERPVSIPVKRIFPAMSKSKARLGFPTKSAPTSLLALV